MLGCLVPFLHFSLNADKRRAELVLVRRQNQAIYQRLLSRQSEYRRQTWLDDWQKAERRRESISQYPRGLGDKQVGGSSIVDVSPQ